MENQTPDPKSDLSILSKPTIQNEENIENQTPDPKSDLKMCLTYVKNQCGKHALKNELLNMHRATFYRKMKANLNTMDKIDPENGSNIECEFCKLLLLCTSRQ